MSLHDAGTKIAIVDFGTAYFSLSLLLGLPTDELKIDRSLVKDVLSNKGGRAERRDPDTGADGVFFFASGGASSAYLTVSEVFPLEIQAMAIAELRSVIVGLWKRSKRFCIT